jgi:aryl-alcohol dehydrogenase-like predicted oxidoreductase
MQLNQLGQSGIRVSAAGLGVMSFGDRTSEADGFRQLDMAIEAGITLFDTAENYPSPPQAATQGRSETILGRWIANRGMRDRVIVATKVAGPGKAGGVIDMSHLRGEQRRLDRANIHAAVDGSLRRLATDYIDLYQVHWPERPVTTLSRARFSHIVDAPTLVPIEETLGALIELVDLGKVRQIGICNESPWGAMQYLALSRANGWRRIVSVQNGYSLLDRQFELGLAEVAMREQVGLLAYSPLARGLLSEARLQAMSSDGASSEPPKDRRHMAVAYRDLARRHGLSLTHMALSFVRQKPFTTAVLLAASSAEQLADNLRSLDLQLAPGLLKEIDALHDARPNPRQ